ncbi:carbon-nitrogen hydrolase family protein [Streptomyces spinosisporus]|uniref:Carbon-nitrogen hydrolase family protein n=1 Tax=Streptomyces spinosisporus TaxID=2927582 RepID=A0ABS9XDG9_9ACTN|nr:carbon-nitrogen hydrolase family protein [Streptomyces spinosisporus]MCI3240078.1 carbon-nitrogen hydrolase family protein [Streptomyces spinosisporus]
MRVAVVQTQWVDDHEDGLRNAHQAIEDVCSAGDIDLVCFPEFLLGPPWYMPGQDGLKGRTDTPIPGPVVDGFQTLARKLGTHILLGSIVEDLQDGMYRNTSLLIGRQGVITGRAIKAHAFGNEMVVCRQADSLGVMSTEFGQIGIAVCSDFWIPEVIRLLALAGARTIFVPGGTLGQNQPLMVNALRTAAYLNDVNIVYASSVGVVRGKRGDRLVEIHFAGTSLVARPEGVIAQAGSDKPEVLVVDLDEPAPGDGRRWQQLRRPGAYQKLLTPYAGQNRDLAAELRASLTGGQGPHRGPAAAATSATEGTRP